ERPLERRLRVHERVGCQGGRARLRDPRVPRKRYTATRDARSQRGGPQHPEAPSRTARRGGRVGRGDTRGRAARPAARGRGERLMGTRYEDQPVEQWAGPESLDPTPVWKQYLLVAAFVLVALVLLAVVAYRSLAGALATPPASVIGGRVVLAAADVPSVGGTAKLYGAPLVDPQHRSEEHTSELQSHLNLVCR